MITLSNLAVGALGYFAAVGVFTTFERLKEGLSNRNIKRNTNHSRAELVKWCSKNHEKYASAEVNYDGNDRLQLKSKYRGMEATTWYVAIDSAGGWRDNLARSIRDNRNLVKGVYMLKFNLNKAVDV